MSVAHIGARTTDDLLAFSSCVAADDSMLYIDDLSAAKTFAIEFTLGEAWSERYSVTDDSMFKIHAETGVRLHGLASIVVETRQTIHVPYNMYGIIVPTGSLFLDRGIIMAAAKIEPAFEGKLRLRLVNTTDREVRLKIGDKLASGIFITTQTTTHPAPVRRQSRIIDRGPGLRHLAGKWIGDNYKTVIGWFVTALFGAVSAKLFL